MRWRKEPFKRKLTICKQYGGMLQMIQTCGLSMSQELVLIMSNGCIALLLYAEIACLCSQTATQTASAATCHLPTCS